jgi:hypothetical protein
LRRLARQQFAAGAHPQALATAMSGLELAPGDEELQKVVGDLSSTARVSVQRARQLAEAAGPAAVTSAGFKDAAARQELAARLGKNRQAGPSLKAYWEAADLFTAVAAQAKGPAAADLRRSPPATVPAPPVVAPPSAAAATPTPAAGVTGPPAAAPPAATPPPASDRPATTATPSVPAPPPQTAPRPPAAPGPADESLIRSTLQNYVQAYSDLDAGAVKRTFPGIDAPALSQAFAQMRAQRIQIEREQVVVSGTTATVTCQVRQHFEPKAGRVSDSVVTATFALQKTAGGWVIVQRR